MVRHYMTTDVVVPMGKYHGVISPRLLIRLPLFSENDFVPILPAYAECWYPGPKPLKN